MEKNKFVVDLGNMELDDDHYARINSAIQKAVAGELALINRKKQIVLIPFTPFAKGPILNGMVVRAITQERLEGIMRQ